MIDYLCWSKLKKDYIPRKGSAEETFFIVYLKVNVLCFKKKSNKSNFFLNIYVQKQNEIKFLGECV